MSCQPAGVFCVGVEPPPDRIEPRLYLAMSLLEGSARRSACVIWPTFSASVIRPRRSETRWSTGSELSRYGSPCAPILIVAGDSGTPLPGLVGSSGTDFASAPPLGESSVTGNVLTVPEAVPAGNVSVPDAVV